MHRQPLLRAAALALALLPYVATRVLAQSTPTMQAVTFMVGCWHESEGDGLREYYAPPSANMMTGLSQFWRAGRIVDWEFHRLDLGADGPTLTPHPRGVASVTFAPVIVEPGHVAWENPDHDFPNRITYRRTAPDSLLVEIRGGDGASERALSWRLARASCTEG